MSLGLSPHSFNPPANSVPIARENIAKANKETQDLRVRIAEHHDYIADNQRIICFINRLPAEILCLIFLCTIGVPHCGPQYITTEGAWLVSQVCKRWRDVALSSQQLWSFPIIYPIANQSVSQFNLQLSRSGNAHLHPALTGDRDLAHLSKLLGSHLARSSHRWISLIFTLDWTKMQDQFAFLRGNVGELEELQIEGWWDTPETVTENYWLEVFAIAPRLRKLIFRDVCEPAISLVLPWHQLAHYRAICNAHEHLSVLRLCPNLVSAHLVFLNVPSLSVDDAQGMVYLPHLLHLNLGDSEFLRILSLPKLCEITMQNAPEGDAFLPLLGLIRCDHPSLASIIFIHAALVTSTLVSVVRENPMVEMLRLQIHRSDTAAVNELLTRLTIDPDHAECFAPNLRMLDLSGRSPFNQMLLVAMVKSRRERTAVYEDCICRPIEQLVIRATLKKALSRNTLEDLQVLAQAGLYLSISTSFVLDSESDWHYWVANSLRWIESSP
ncbi:hypothetical protein K438DRAFT_1983562 [Mycena galopus ATCC 62051]|nr:hypothetical protein K438DRAFT_1983562 [Mycena galopus ATCC 62051]